jgi:hypothetical protein
VGYFFSGAGVGAFSGDAGCAEVGDCCCGAGVAFGASADTGVL